LEWIEVTLYTTGQGMEPVCAMLADAGVDNVRIEDPEEMRRFLLDADNRQWDYVDEALLEGPLAEPRVLFYLPDTPEGRDTLQAVRAGADRLGAASWGLDLGRLALEWAGVNDEDWLHQWKKHYKPFEICDGVVVCPVWEPYDASGKILFRIEPGHVFGTGLHQTTRLCAQALRKFLRPKAALLDVGCGTGILSIIGLLLGAGQALGIDLDPCAADIAQQNAALNGVGAAYKTLAGSLLEDPALLARAGAVAYDLAVMNIVADTVIALAPVVRGLLGPAGVLIASGIIRGRLEETQAALAGAGFKILEITEQDEWFCLVARKEAEHGAVFC
jgi:ribosomal protein L11 methyltransferase